MSRARATHYRARLKTIITCRHVIENHIVLYRSKFKNGRIHRKIIGEEIPEIGTTTSWIFHQDDNIDLAACPVPEIKDSRDLCFSTEYFGNTDELYEGDEVFYFGFPLGVGAELATPHHPILRTGSIAQKRETDKFLIEANVFPGSSGSPVFFQNDQESLRFIGILKSYIPYEDVAVSRQTGLVRVIFQENSGLASVIDIKCVKEILDSPEFKGIADRIVEATIEGIIK